MYEQHFGLNKRPFLAKATGGDVFVGPQTANTMAGLKKALAAQDAVVSVAGPAGAGKTTLVAKALDALKGTHRSVRIGRMQLNGTDALEFLLEELGTGEVPRGPIRQFAAFRELIQQLENTGRHLVIVVEDAIRTGIETLAELEALTAADAGDAGGAALVIMGDEGVAEYLADPQLTRLAQRQRQRLAIKPLSVAELRGYLMHCFRRAGGEYDDAFDAKSADVLHGLSGGVPRIANYVAEAALSAAAVDGVSPVAAETIAKIARDEFGMELPPGILDADEPEVPATPAVEAEVEPEPDPGQPAAPQADATPDPEPEQPEAEAAHEPEPLPSAMPDSGPDNIPVLEAEPEPQSTPEADAPNPDPIIVFTDADDGEELRDDDIPELIQDTLPDLEVLAPEVMSREDTQTELPVLNPAPETNPEPTLEPEPSPEPDPESTLDGAPERMPEPPVDVAAEPAPAPALDVEPDPAPDPVVEPVLDAEPEPSEDPVLDIEPEPVAEPALDLEPEQVAEPALDLEPEPLPDPVLEAEAEPVVDKLPDNAPGLTADSADDDVPEWDRDPTLAELRPDLDALEKAMAFAHGESEVEEEAEAADDSDNELELEEIPEITLDSSIKQSIENTLIDEPDGVSEPEPMPGVAPAPAAAPPAAAPRKARQADAEIEKIAAELAKAKTIEDVDDKLAETLFGDEINMIAAQVMASGPAESANDAALYDTQKAQSAQAPGSATPAAHSEPAPRPTPAPAAQDAVEVSIESPERGDSGLDLSASQRLKTVRALNADLHPSLREPGNGPDPGPDVPARDNAAPEPIEDQINTSITQTLKALKVTPPISDDDDVEEKKKGGFFSRFKRS